MIGREMLIGMLIADFIKAFPHATRGEIIDLKARLNGFDLDDLKLLVSQLGKEGTTNVVRAK